MTESDTRPPCRSGEPPDTGGDNPMPPDPVESLGRKFDAFAAEIRGAIEVLRSQLVSKSEEHSRRLDEHAGLLTNLGATQTQQGQRLAAMEAVAIERAKEDAARRAVAESERTAHEARQPNWTAIVAVVIAAVMAVIALAPYVINAPGR